MTEVLSMMFPPGIAETIDEYAADATDAVEWMTVYGATEIYKTKHIITYGGGPEGGYVYFYRERVAGWYEWHRDWMQPPAYTKVDGQIAIFWDDGVERIGVVPWDYEPEEDEDITIMTDDIMQEQD